MSARAERRWIVLGQDGRHVTLGRSAPPSASGQSTAIRNGVKAARGAWIATLDGDYWGRGRVTLAPVQTIGAAATLDWPPAVAGFLEARQRARRAA